MVKTVALYKLVFFFFHENSRNQEKETGTNFVFYYLS